MVRGRVRRGSVVVAWWAAVCTLVVGGALPASADVASDRSAAIVVFPKVVVDIDSPQIAPPAQVDTLIRISNVSDQAISLRCFWTDATPHCSDGSGSCLSDPVSCQLPGVCVPQWQETDFVVHLTAGQPVAWLASRGAVPCAESAPGLPCFPAIPGNLPPNRVLPVPEDPFVGELRCIAVDRNDVPVERNALQGEAEIVRSSEAYCSDGSGSCLSDPVTCKPPGECMPQTIDVAAYNAIGIPAYPGANDKDNTLVLGGVCVGGTRTQLPCVSPADCPGGRCPAEYAGCPNILVLDHFFDGAVDPVSKKVVTTDLTLIPCTTDYLTQAPVTTPVQFLVFNEFEQRFSTSRSVTCFSELKISNIDTRTSDRSLFNAAVAGTLTGQTRIRGVADGHPDHGHTLLGLAEEFRRDGGSAAFNLHFHGSRPQSDFIYLP